jgi:hypothetical protein
MTDRVFDAQKAFISFGAKAAGGMAVAAAAVAAFNVRNQLKELDELEAKANAIGMNSGALAGLQHAAAMTDVDADKLTQGITLLSKAVVDATAGSKGVSAVFDELGLNANELVKLSPDRMFVEVAEAISQIENPAERMYATLKLFGKSGSELANVLALGKDGMGAMQREAEALGLALSSTDMGKIAAANDELDKANEALRGMWRTLTVDLAPAISNLAKIASGLARDLNAVFGGKQRISRTVEFAQQMQENELGRPLREGEAISWEHMQAAIVAIDAMDTAAKALADAQNKELETATSAATVATSYADAVARIEAETKAATAATKAATEAKRKEAEIQRAISAEAERIAKKASSEQEARLKPISDATDMLSRWRSEATAMSSGMTDRQAQIAELERSLRWSGKGAGAKTLEDLRAMDEELTRLELNKQIQDDLASAPEFSGPRFSGAMEKGSAEAYSTILNAGKDSEKTAKAHLQVGRMTLTQLQEINRKTSTSSTVSIPSL